jgi:hypothetical protein
MHLKILLSKKFTSANTAFWYVTVHLLVLFILRGMIAYRLTKKEGAIQNCPAKVPGCSCDGCVRGTHPGRQTNQFSKGTSGGPVPAAGGQKADAEAR